MGERAELWVARHPPRRCSENEPSALNVRTYELDAANVGSSSRDFSLHFATGSNRPCCAVHPDDSACPLMFSVHSLYIAKFCDTSTRLHVRVTSMDQCCLGLHLAAVVGRHVRQWTVQCAESLVHGLDTLLGESNVEFHSRCVAGLRQARELGGGERNTQDRVLWRGAQLVTVGQSSTHCRRYHEREGALSELDAFLQREFQEAHHAGCQSAHA